MIKYLAAAGALASDARLPHISISERRAAASALLPQATKGAQRRNNKGNQ
jgi:hypothetical protein